MGLLHGDKIMTKSVIGQPAKMVIAATILCRDYAAMSDRTPPRIPREMMPDKIGQRLALLREAYGMKSSEMADYLGIERTYWTRFERGHRPPSDEVAFLLTERFNITLDWLLLGKMDKLPLDVADKLRAAATN